MFVEVVVDVNSSNINQTYYYKLPNNYSDKSYLGYRVNVPFGKRVIQGYIVGVSSEIEFSEKKLKNIISIKDEFPVLTEELILLSNILAKELYCRRIQVIETIIPTIFKNKYIEYYKLLVKDGLLFNYKKYFNEENLIKKSELENKISEEEIKYLLNNKIIKLVNVGIEQKKEKDVNLLVLNNYFNEEKLTIKQQKIVDYLLKYKFLDLKNLKSELEVGNSVVNKLIEKNIARIVNDKSIIKNSNDYSIYNNDKTLNAFQEKIFKSISKNIDKNMFEEFLLHGITGSGKTEIYINLAKKYIDYEKDVLILVPEIILTPQMEERFKEVFGESIAIIHSRLSKREKYQEWKKIIDNRVKICVGTRSSIFAPFKKVGLIIIDEEHESTYKQNETPRYDTKDVARKRAIFNKATLLYASATPSVDLYYKFLNENKENLLTLDYRHNSNLPIVEKIMVNDKNVIISEKLKKKIEETLEKKEQIILFINKRGYTNYISCSNCNYLFKCENCDITLNYHKKENRLYCHFCDYKKSVSSIKKCCSKPDLISGGYGIQKVEEYIRENFSNIKITRMDSDTTRRKGSYEKLISEFKSGKSQILLGTQMISKGLDFPNVTLVGILSIGNLLSIPSFKTNEKLFQLLVQTSGRAGRSNKKGRVFIQSSIDSKVIDFAIDNNYIDFYNYEINRRELINYPPFCNLSFINIKGKDEKQTYLLSMIISNFLRENFNIDKVMGPNRSIFYKINNEYTYNIYVRYTHIDYKKLNNVLNYINNYFISNYEKSNVSVIIDNNPQDYL